jgi:hypothetical protein
MCQGMLMPFFVTLMSSGKNILRAFSSASPHMDKSDLAKHPELNQLSHSVVHSDMFWFPRPESGDNSMKPFCHKFWQIVECIVKCWFVLIFWKMPLLKLILRSINWLENWGEVKDPLMWIFDKSGFYWIVSWRHRNGVLMIGNSKRCSFQKPPKYCWLAASFRWRNPLFSAAVREPLLLDSGCHWKQRVYDMIASCNPKVRIQKSCQQIWKHCFQLSYNVASHYRFLKMDTGW